jgi:hypothetical protein
MPQKPQGTSCKPQIIALGSVLRELAMGSIDTRLVDRLSGFPKSPVQNMAQAERNLKVNPQSEPALEKTADAWHMAANPHREHGTSHKVL